jgi:hypothetical protein
MKRGAAVLCAVVGLVSACAPPPRAPDRVTPLDWTNARRRLASIRATESTGPYSVLIRCAMREPLGGHVYEARGALAVLPHTAMRMVLLGPAGATALDLWITRDKWRLVAPTARFERRGTSEAEDTRGLPIGFFRWWFLAPLAGRMLSSAPLAGGASFVLRDGGGVVLVREETPDGTRELHLTALRREAGGLEALEWRGHDLSPRAGDRARYVQDASGLEVEVVVDAVIPDEPDAAVFLDPDLQGVSL